MLQEAEAHAFAELYDQHFAQISRFVYDRDLAEDVTSTVFARSRDTGRLPSR